MKSIIISTILVILCTSNLVSALNHTICDQDKSLATIKNVIVSDCEQLTSEPCPFYRGFNKSIELDFVPKQDIDEVKVKVVGKLNTLPVNFLVKPEEACGNYGFDCPLKADKTYKFKLTLPILRSYPKINVDVFLRLVDKKGDLISCLNLPAAIREPVKPPTRR